MFRIITIVCFCIIAGCNSNNRKATHISTGGERIEGDLIIFHAGSLSVPFKKMTNAFESLYPDVNILLESAGSVSSARKITDLNKKCDIMASADIRIIEEMLIPDHTAWCIPFASNEMALVYTGKSRLNKKITTNNWYEILLNEEVVYGRSDPNSDPCGYRAIQTMKLAEKHYKLAGLTMRFLSKDNRFIRPKEVELIALLETGIVDYIFIYRSVAQQHNLFYLSLPDEINLANPELADLYAQVSIEIYGKNPGDRIIKFGEPMVYGVTILEEAPNRRAAELFTSFLLNSESGLKIMESNGQPSLVPSPTQSYEQVPESLKQFTKPIINDR